MTSDSGHSQAIAPFFVGSDSFVSILGSRVRLVSFTNPRESRIWRPSTHLKRPGKPLNKAYRTRIEPTFTTVSIITCAQSAMKRCHKRSTMCFVRTWSTGRTLNRGWSLLTNHPTNQRSPALSGTMWCKISTWRTRSTSMLEIYTRVYRSKKTPNHTNKVRIVIVSWSSWQ